MKWSPLFVRAPLLAMSLFAAGPALAQTVAPSPGVIGPSALGFGALAGPYTSVTKTTPLPAEPTTTAASSVPQEGSITPSTAVATSGTAAIAAGVATIGPLAPQLGRDIRVILKGTWAGSFAIGTSSAANACAAGTINPLTAGGQAWGVFTGNANEVVDTPSLGATPAGTPPPVYCATATITSGALTYAVRQ